MKSGGRANSNDIVLHHSRRTLRRSLTLQSAENQRDLGWSQSSIVQIQKTVPYANCATSIVAYNSHSLYRTKQRCVSGPRVHHTKDNYVLLDARWWFPFTRTLARDRRARLLFSLFALFHDITRRGHSSVRYPTRRRLDRGIKKKVLRAGCLAQLWSPRAANCLLPGLITSLCYSVNARRKPLCLPRLNSRLAYIYVYTYIYTHISFKRIVADTTQTRDCTREGEKAAWDHRENASRCRVRAASRRFISRRRDPCR